MATQRSRHLSEGVAVLRGALLLTLLGSSVAAVRVCVTGHSAATACHKMESQKTPVPLSCFVTQDRYDCLLRLVSKEADVTLAVPEDVFLAKEILDGKVHVIGQTRELTKRTDPMRYDSVAVVRKASVTSLQSLKGSKSCHTGYRRTAGWHIPISHLLEKQLMQLSCGSGVPPEHDLMAASNFFGLACVPGHWAPDEKTNTMLKKKYPNLCAMCASPGDCDDQDQHGGYLGALDCLTHSNGDVAWTKFDAVTTYFNMSEEKSAMRDEYALLCPDGTLRDLDQPCPWASRPWDAWLTRTGHENADNINKALKSAMEAATIGNDAVSTKVEEWATQVLGINVPSTVVAFSTPTTPYKYLSSALYDVTVDRLACPEDPIRLCVTSDTAMDKCWALSQILRSRRVSPRLACERQTDCLMAVSAGKADIASLDGADVYRGYTEHDLVPLVTEKYGLQESSYFAVAVVRANSGINGIQDLRGKKSCHTGIDRTAGWKVPVVALLEAGLLKKGNCNYAHEIGGLFDSSCVPGAKSPRYDPNGDNPESLCRLCVGSKVAGAGGAPYQVSGSEGRCDRGDAEAYSGYSGAFRCLVEGGGDVAFIKHTTVGENINSGPGNSSSWAADLKVVDFRLLCRGGGTADVVDFATCHLARVPAHKVVISKKASPTRKEEARILLLAASRYFRKGQYFFILFGPFHGHNDVIFKDTATELVNIPDDGFHNSLDDTYYGMLKELQTCVPTPEVEQIYKEMQRPSNASLTSAAWSSMAGGGVGMVVMVVVGVWSALIPGIVGNF